jgi:hypothetical protein
VRGVYTISATNPLGTATKSITIGAYFGPGGKMGQSVCWWDSNSYFKCWGYNVAGGLGDGTNTSRTTAQITTPAATQGANAVMSYATTQLGSTCLLTSGGAVYCSGYNGHYELGIGTTSNSNSFGLASGMTSGYASITSVPYGFCALNTSGSLYCWGSSSGTQFTGGAVYTTPTVSSIISNVSSISGGNDSMCSLNSSYAVYCWGFVDNAGGGSIINWGATATAVTGAFSPIYLSGTGDTYCVINLSGTVSCMGDYYYGQFGQGSASSSSSFIAAMSGVTTASQVVCGGGSGDDEGSGASGSCCVLLISGTVQCAGYNSGGALGQGSYSPNESNSPLAVSGLSNVVALQSFGSGLAATGTNTHGFCAITQSGSMMCWGTMYSSFGTPTVTTISGIP